MTNRENFPKNLRRLMERGQYNQADIVNHMGVTSSTVSSWCTGQKYPRADMLERLAKFFNVSVFELVCESDTDEERLLRAFRVLNPTGKKKALERMDELTQLYWYNKKVL